MGYKKIAMIPCQSLLRVGRIRPFNSPDLPLLLLSFPSSAESFLPITSCPSYQLSSTVLHFCSKVKFSPFLDLKIKNHVLYVPYFSRLYRPFSCETLGYVIPNSMSQCRMIVTEMLTLCKKLNPLIFTFLSFFREGDSRTGKELQRMKQIFFIKTKIIFNSDENLMGCYRKGSNFKTVCQDLRHS